VLEQHCKETGRDSSEIVRSVMVGHIIGTNNAEVRERAARIQKIMPSMQGLSLEEVMERTHDRGWLVGTPDKVIQDIQALAQMGVSRLMLQTHDQEDMTALELFATAIMPEVAKL